MILTSTDFEDGGEIPEKFTCNGEGSRPSLEWAEVPSETKSLAISLVDPDAPSGNFVHWLAINLPTSAAGIEANETIGTELPNSSGNTSYVAPCPPTGRHHYIFTLYALDTERLENFESVTAHAIDQATLTGLYGKN